MADDVTVDTTGQGFPIPDLGGLNLDPAAWLLARLCRADPLQEGERDLFLSMLQGDARVGAFLGMADQQKVQGLVLNRLKDLGGFPDSVFLPLPLLRRKAVFWELEQDRVLQHLLAEGLDFVLLKGGALRRTVYRSAVERPMTDLDLLTTPEVVPEALRALKALGYGSKYPEGAKAGFQEHHYHERVTHSNGFEVEVHWGLTRPDAPFSLNPEVFLRRARAKSLDGGLKVPVPASEDMVLHLVSQSEQDGIRSLRRIVDLDRVIRGAEGPEGDRLDWGEVRHGAEEGKLSAVLAVVLRLANVFLATPVPEDLLRGDGIRPLARWTLEGLDPVARLLDPSEHRRWVNDTLFRLWCLPSWSDRKRWVRNLSSGEEDPLLWIWEEEDRPRDQEPSLGRGVLKVMKLLVYQGWHFGGWTVAALPGTRRSHPRFWLESRHPSA